MKNAANILFLLLPVTALAQNYPGMTEADMQKLIKMQSCIERVDQEQLRAVEERQIQFEDEVYALCGRGDRDEAQKKALAFDKEMVANPALQAIQKCENIAREMITRGQRMAQGEDEVASNQHICDSL